MKKHGSGDSESEQGASPMHRRRILGAGAKLLGTAALLKAASALVAGGAWAAGEDRMEKRDVTLGFIPLTDCAPLAIAKEKGYFQKHGLNVSLSKEASWSSIRDKVSVGALDGAHMLAAMPIATTLGVGSIKKPMITALSLDLNGNAITVSNVLYKWMCEVDPEAMRERPMTARALKKVIEARRADGQEALTFAVVYPVSTHNYQLRYWMAAAGIDPDNDVRIVVIPPPQMVANLRAGNIVGYSVGEPWNQRAVAAGLGKVLITSYEIWNNGPEKVLGVNRDWVERHPATHKAMLAAVLEAGAWLDEPENRLEAATILAGKTYVDAPLDDMKMSMSGMFRYGSGEEPRAMPDFHVFHRYAASFPWRSHASWFITQMLRWGQLKSPIDIQAVAASVYRPDLYRAAARERGLPLPLIDEKTEGTHATSWVLQDASAPITMGADAFFDGRSFDSRAPYEYLAGFAVSRWQSRGPDIEQSIS